MILAALLSLAQRPDLVVFMIDDVAATDVSTYGGPAQTPNLTALAARGVKYDRAYAHARCAPTRDSFYFGRFLGYERGDACAPPVPGISHTTIDKGIAKIFEGAGYNTVHIGKWHVGVEQLGPWQTSPEMMGWGTVRATVPVGPDCSETGSSQPQLNDGVYTTSPVDSSVRCRDAFLQVLQDVPSPRLIVVEFGSAHEPFKYPPSSILPAGYPPCGLVNCTNRKEFNAEIAGVDFVMQQCIDALGPEAWIVYLGDNGTPGNTPDKPPSVTDATRPDQNPDRVKLTCYEDGIRVPLVIAGPVSAQGFTSHALIHVADLLPTLAQIAGIEPEIQVQGRRFGSTLIGLPGPRTPILLWNPPPRLDRAMVGPRWKLLTDEFGVEALYDLANDPTEQSPLAPVGPEADHLRVLRDALLASG